ncbi:MAG: TonB-dependent receptor, partial [Pseudomonadales bacterium]
FEFGMKGDFFDRRVRLNLAAFTSDYDDKQEEIIQLDNFGGTITVVQNAATVNLWGIEAELNWAATENLVINANFGYLDAEYDDYVADLNGDGVETDNSSLILRRVPEWTGGINGVYTRRIGPGTLSAFAGYRYTDEYWVDASNNPQGLLDDRGVIDASISYEWEWADGRDVTITVFGRDITDEQNPNSAVIIPGFFSFAGIAGGEQYGLQISGSF